MPYLKFALAALSLFLFSAATQARDLDKSDPVRKQLLDAAREQPDEKFMVKYLIHEGNFAYLCALKVDKNGGIYGTDEDLDVYKYLLVKQGDQWISRTYRDGLTPKYQESDCAPEDSKFEGALPTGLSDDMHAIQSSWMDAMLMLLREEPDPRKWNAEDQKAYAALRAQGLLKTYPVDIVGKEMFGYQLKYNLQTQNVCKTNRACVESADKSLAQIKKLAASNTVSELVWYGCDRSLQNDDKIEHLQQCVARFQSKPYCRVGMDYFNDRADVTRCFSEMKQMPIEK